MPESFRPESWNETNPLPASFRDHRHVPNGKLAFKVLCTVILGQCLTEIEPRVRSWTAGNNKKSHYWAIFNYPSLKCVTSLVHYQEHHHQTLRSRVPRFSGCLVVSRFSLPMIRVGDDDNKCNHSRLCRWRSRILYACISVYGCVCLLINQFIVQVPRCSHVV